MVHQLLASQVKQYKAMTNNVGMGKELKKRSLEKEVQRNINTDKNAQEVQMKNIGM